MSVKTNRTEYGGPDAWDNWMAAQDGLPATDAFEYPLFTDAVILGELSFGPYHLLNTVCHGSPQHPSAQVASPALVLRVDHYLEYQIAPMDSTDASRYHGGDLAAEIAALVSVCLGIRLKSGGRTRQFGPKADPRGRPVAFYSHENPVLFRPSIHYPVLPRAGSPHKLRDAEFLTEFNALAGQDAMALVRASRLYQDGVWIAESQPELAWVMLVSAVEAAAGHWRASLNSPEQRLRASRPDLVRLLDDEGGSDLVSSVAPLIADYMGSTKKFIDFAIKFRPKPPSPRPPQHARLAWDKRSLRRALRTVYRWRSKALHGGTPFPLPMCEAPRQLEEKPMGLATHARGGVWVAKDTPMLLHTFEHIVRGTLINWRRSMLQAAQPAHAADGLSSIVSK